MDVKDLDDLDASERCIEIQEEIEKIAYESDVLEDSSGKCFV